LGGVKRAVGTLFGCCLLAMLVFAAAAGAASLQSIGVFKSPIYVTSDPGNPNALYVVQREGQVVVSENGAVREFADLRSVVGCCGGETGLLSIALAPDFDTSGRLFVDYTDAAGEIHVAEMRGAAGATAPIASLRNLLTIPHPTYTNHYGGQLQFGPEGLLYISTGDGGGENDVGGNAQSLSSLLGKILRIDPSPSVLAPYTIPPGNPFAGLPAPYSTVFSYGLRNPYRFSFDRISHDLVIADVGQAAREEIDWAPAPGLGAGADYGWNCFEGKVPGTAPEPGCKTPPAGGYTFPVFEYGHEGGADAIIGGYVVRDPSLESLYGRYLYGDFGNGGLRSLNLADAAASDRSEGLTVSELSSFGEDSCGRLYVVSGSGVVSRLVGSTANTCTAPVAAVPLAPSVVGIKAVTRRVRHNGRAQITAWVTPCAGRRGEPIQLWQGKRKIGVHRLDRACTARFLPKVRHKVRFRAAIAADATYIAGSSRNLGFHVFHPKKEKKDSKGGRLHIPPGVGHR
jgi:hypothetical protein